MNCTLGQESIITPPPPYPPARSEFETEAEWRTAGEQWQAWRKLYLESIGRLPKEGGAVPVEWDEQGNPIKWVGETTQQVIATATSLTDKQKRNLLIFGGGAIVLFMLFRPRKKRYIAV